MRNDACLVSFDMHNLGIASHLFHLYDTSAKTPAVQIKRQVTSVSPTHKSLEDEVIYLRSQNKLLKNALNAVKDTANDKLVHSYELVWYARNRSKCTNH